MQWDAVMMMPGKKKVKVMEDARDATATSYVELFGQ